MNMKQAKQYLKDTVQIYLKKDEYGEYCIPVVRQRPLFLLGVPGIGKTAVVEQVAEELGIALVSYSMTHHTRQSALGLPFIVHKEYEGKEFDISEYTMSEIIASVYEVMEKSKVKQGILFLDEINCVSETLAPSMLQFLQYKVFGRHQVPEGWVIVTAGNPPEYNRSVREFDIVTMDRMRVLMVEEDFSAWREYAVNKGIHNAIISYLEQKKEHFYIVETTVGGKDYVTARGWEDLSQVLRLYESEELPVDETLVGQYLHCDRVVKEYTAYYELYCKYKRDYQIEAILSGEAGEKTVQKAKDAPFDERLSILGILIERLLVDIRENLELSDVLSALLAPLKAVGERARKGADISEILDMLADRQNAFETLMIQKKEAGALSDIEKRKNRRMIQFLTDTQSRVRMESLKDAEAAFDVIKQCFDGQVRSMREENGLVQRRMHALFDFVEQAFSDGNEMLLLVTELTINEYSSRFISMFGSDDFLKHQEEMMLSERQSTLMGKIAELEL